MYLEAFLFFVNVDRYALLNGMFFKLADLDILIKNTMLSEKEKGGPQACLRFWFPHAHPNQELGRGWSGERS